MVMPRMLQRTAAALTLPPVGCGCTSAPRGFTAPRPRRSPIAAGGCARSLPADCSRPGRGSRYLRWPGSRRTHAPSPCSTSRLFGRHRAHPSTIAESALRGCSHGMPRLRPLPSPVGDDGKNASRNRRASPPELAPAADEPTVIAWFMRACCFAIGPKPGVISSLRLAWHVDMDSPVGPA